MKKHLRSLTAFILCTALLCGFAGAFADDARIGGGYREAVAAMADRGVLAGYEDGSFGPEDTLTREQAAKIVAFLLLGREVAAALSCEEAPFDDVPVTLWSAPYVSWCLSEGILHGYDDGLFHPQDWLTCNQFAKMLLCALGYGSGEDYSGDRWPSAVLADGDTAGLYRGDPDMASDTYIMRQQAALMAWNCAEKAETPDEAA